MIPLVAASLPTEYCLVISGVPSSLPSTVTVNTFVPFLAVLTVLVLNEYKAELAFNLPPLTK